MSLAMVLYVEDEENDVLLFRLALRRRGIVAPMLNVSDGVQAVDYLQGKGEFSDRERYPAPGLMLLDLNLPRVSGFQVLQWLRSQVPWQALPVYVCTSSVRDEDREQAMRLGATGYVIKSPDYAEMIAVVQRVVGGENG